MVVHTTQTVSLTENFPVRATVSDSETLRLSAGDRSTFSSTTRDQEVFFTATAPGTPQISSTHKADKETGTSTTVAAERSTDRHDKRSQRVVEKVRGR